MKALKTFIGILVNSHIGTSLTLATCTEVTVHCIKAVPMHLG